jgi:glutamate racemase
VETYQPDVLVVACNTASTIVLPSLRARFSIPVVGVVPAIKPAAQISRTRVIGLLATPGTVRRQYTDALIREFASDCTVNMVGTSELVAMAERKLRGTPVDLDALKHEIQPLFERAPNATGKIDTVVLGCTHFPMLVDELVQCSPWPISWIDSSEAVANRVLTIAAQLPERPTPATSPQHIALFTSSQGMDELRPWLTNLGVVPATFS